MKLLVFAHTPPPVHGQSIMVAMLLAGLREDPRFQVYHVNPQLSRSSRDIGRWRPGKLFALLGACVRAWGVRLRRGRAYFYYVPAPGKRGALYRDLIVMALCRPFFAGLVLHWHAVGLGEWLEQHAHPLERWLARRLLGGAALSIVLGENLRADAGRLAPRRMAVVRNGIADPCPDFTYTPERGEPPAVLEALFLGLCSRDKGLFTALAGVREANTRTVSGRKRKVRLTVAGEFPDEATARAFATEAAALGDAVRHVGFMSGPQKHQLLARSHVLVFPTRYAHEAQPLVVAEALAFDVPVITTRWRAVHENLPERHVYFVDPDSTDQVADALGRVAADGPAQGNLRQHFLAHYTSDRHVASLKDTLLSVAASGAAAVSAVAPSPQSEILER